MKKQKFFFTVLFLSLGLLQLDSNASQHTATGSHGGQIVEKAGIDYEIVHDQEHREMRVYTQGVPNSVPNGLTVKVHTRSGLSDRIHLNLIQTDPMHSYYLGNVPASIFISGGVTFDIDF